MTPELQSVLALIVVSLAAAYLVWRSWRKRRSGGCGSGECGAISPEMRKLQAQFRRTPR